MPHLMHTPFLPPGGPETPRVSFEFFPPKTEKMEETLWASLEVLAPLKPAFVSVTYGAGGSTRARTHEIVTKIQDKTGVPAAAHLTCIGSTREEIAEIAHAYRAAGITRIVALRGDMPPDYVAPPGAYTYAAELVADLEKMGGFDISVAGYPEKHPEALSADADLDNLKRKIDAGADRVITQFFMEAQTFLRFRDGAAAAGIHAPIVPGILPITNFEKTVEFAGKCGASVPAWMPPLFSGLDERPQTRQLVAATAAAALCRELHAEGVRDFHFYTLNRAELTAAICHMMGLRAA